SPTQAQCHRRSRATISAAVGINSAHALLVNHTRVVSTEATRGVQAAVQDVKPWVERAARVGHAAKGIVYLLVGFFALAADLGMRHEPDGPESAFMTLRDAPLGKILLATVALGLLYYAV